MLKIFPLTLLITTLTVIVVGLLINFCRKRLAKTPHGLSGMCHQQGGEICSSCRGKAGVVARRTEKKEHIRNHNGTNCKRPATNNGELRRKH